MRNFARKYKKVTCVQQSIITDMQQINMPQAILQIFNSIYAVDFVNDSIEEVKGTPTITDFIHEGLDVRGVIERYVSERVLKPHEMHIREFLDLNTLADRLRNKDFISDLYMSSMYGWIRLWIIPTKWSEDGKSLEKVLLCLQKANGVKQAEDDMKSALDTQYRIVDALAADYFNVYSIDINSHHFRIIKMEGFVSEQLDAYNRSSDQNSNYEPFLEMYINTRVVEEDKEGMRAFMTMDNVLKQLKESGSLNEATYYYRRIVNEEIHHCMAKIKMYDEGMLLLGFQDIDKMIRKEKEQQQLLADALALAEHANKAKTMFLNNMSHDIRTPMNAVIGFTALAAAHEDLPDEVRDYLEKITTSSNHLLSLINDVLDMSRIESGKVKIEETEVHLPDLMHDLKTIVHSEAKAKQLDVFFDTVDVVNEDVFCDRLRLNQVLLNIISNAMKYGRTGGTVSIRIKQRNDSKPGYANYEFHVKDDGVGMSEEFQKHIFEAFTRENSSTASGIQGTGLGMAITKNIVDIMGGSITVKSKKNVGSEFIVSLTLRTSPNSVKYGVIPELQGMKVLVADDDVDTCLSVSSMLTNIGLIPEWTTSGKEAVVRTQYAKDQGNLFKAYIIDWLMPDMNGIETVRRIRRIIDKDCPIIILTAYEWSDIEAEAREAGVTAFCSKPLFLSDLHEVLAKPLKVEASTIAPVPQTPAPGASLSGNTASPSGSPTSPSGSPASPSGSPAIVHEASASGNAARPEAKAGSVLLVEDNDLNIQFIQQFLEKRNLAVDIALNGKEALEKMEHYNEKRYDLMLMDVRMPIMDGLEATMAVRQLKNEQAARIPIVGISANAFAEDKQKALAAGMNDYILKPVDVKQLETTIAKYIK